MQARWRRIRRPPIGLPANFARARRSQCRPCDNAQRARPGSAACRDRCLLRGRRHRRSGIRCANFAPMASAAIEKHFVAGGDLAMDGARNDIARTQVRRIRVQRRHEAAAILVDQDRAFAAQRFGGERRGIAADATMAVGWNCTNSGSAISAPARAAMPRPSPRDSERIGGDGVKRAQSAGRKNHRRRTEQNEPRGRARAVAREQARNRGRLPSRVRRRGSLPATRSTAFLAHAAASVADDFSAGAIAVDMHDARGGMGGFAAHRQRAVGIAVEGRAIARPDRRSARRLRAQPSLRRRDRTTRRPPRWCRRHGIASCRLRRPLPRCRLAPRHSIRSRRRGHRPAPGRGRAQASAP